MNKEKGEITLRDILDIFLPKLWIIAIAAIVFGAVSAVYAAFLKDDTYTSKTAIHVAQETDNSTQNINNINFVTRSLSTYVNVLTSSDTVQSAMNYIKDRSDYKDTYTEKGWDKLSIGQIKSYISVSSEDESLIINVTSSDPALSCAIAQALAYLVENHNHEITAYPEDTINTRIYQKAKEGAANSRKVATTALIGVLIGVVLAMAVIFIVNLADVTIRDRKKIEDNFDIPVLGVIPRYIEEGNAK